MSWVKLTGVGGKQTVNISKHWIVVIFRKSGYLGYKEL
jgi:hypothetical protein